MNKEAFDLLLQKAANAAASLAQSAIPYGGRQGVGAMLTILDDAKRRIVEGASLPDEVIKNYGLTADKANRLIDRQYAIARKAPAIQSYSDFGVTRSVPLNTAGGVAGGSAIMAGLSALLGRRFAPLKSLRNAGRMAIGGAGVGGAASAYSTSADNRQMLKAKNMLGTEYGINTLQDFRSLSPVVSPKARKKYFDMLAKQSSLGELYANVRPQIVDLISSARQAAELPMNSVPVSSIFRYLKSPAGRMTIGSGLAGAAYGFARQKGPNETAIGNAIRSGLVGAGAGALLGNAIGAPTRPFDSPGVDWRRELDPARSGGGPLLGEGGVHPSHPMYEQFKRNRAAADIHSAYQNRLER